ncbi:MAG: o-succinylbenzoate synthase [Actinomycetota bacterium]|nr:o-succinylbenzoate synthase [Actinomycetota bacterium]
MKLESITANLVRMPLVSPFTTSFSTQTERVMLILRARCRVGGQLVDGWGECVALEDPVYSSEYVAGALEVMRRWLVPRLTDAADVTAESVAPQLQFVVGHRMAKAAVEMAVLDAQLRATDRSLAQYFGSVRSSVPSGVSVGIHDTIPELLDAVAGYLDAGYARIKLKIKPGWDIEPVRAVRERFGPGVPLQVDANAAYTLADTELLRQLDQFDLLLIEQPLAEDDLRRHAELAREMTTPMCLDESIVSLESAEDAIALGAAAVINIKPGRVGGYLEAKRIHDLALAAGVGVWCGGMLETGIGRAANTALAALPGFTLTGDISGSDRFYSNDVTEPVVMHDGLVDVPSRAGLCSEPIPEALARFTEETVVLS